MPRFGGGRSIYRQELEKKRAKLAYEAECKRLRALKEDNDYVCAKENSKLKPIEPLDASLFTPAYVAQLHQRVRRRTQSNPCVSRNFTEGSDGTLADIIKERHKSLHLQVPQKTQVELLPHHSVTLLHAKVTLSRISCICTLAYILLHISAIHVRSEKYSRNCILDYDRISNRSS